MNKETLKIAYDRQRIQDYYSPDKDTCIHLIGAGAIGSFTALFLSKIAPEKVIIYDDDIVEPVNVANQFYNIADTYPESDDKPCHKATILSEKLNDSVGWDIFHPVARRVTSGLGLRTAGLFKNHIVIMAVDSIAAREEIARRILDKEDNIQFILDGRMNVVDAQSYLLIPGVNEEQYFNSFPEGGDNIFQEVSKACGTPLGIPMTGATAASLLGWHFIDAIRFGEMADFKRGYSFRSGESNRSEIKPDSEEGNVNE